MIPTSPKITRTVNKIQEVRKGILEIGIPNIRNELMMSMKVPIRSRTNHQTISITNTNLIRGQSMTRVRKMKGSMLLIIVARTKVVKMRMSIREIAWEDCMIRRLEDS